MVQAPHPKVAYVALGPAQPFFFACAANVLELSRPAEVFRVVSFDFLLPKELGQST